MQAAELVAETLACRGQPIQGLAHQQEGGGVVRPREEKGGAGPVAGRGTGKVAGTLCAAESGTITGIITTAGLTGGGTNGTLTLQLDPTIVRADVSNNFTARQSVIGSSASLLLSATQTNSVVLPGNSTFIQAQTAIPGARPEPAPGQGIGL